MKKSMPVETILQAIVEEMQVCPFVKGIVLGGSRATGTATKDSDVDMGVYYDEFDSRRLNEIARRLDDAHRENLVCHEGGWGNWVNCGAWLMVEGVHVDLILRDYAKVTRIIETSDAGRFAPHYQTGHPHAFLDVMYRGELASCKVLYAADESFLRAKRSAERYPAALKKALVDFFSFEAEFSCALAEKSMGSGDVYYLAGCLFRSVSAVNQVLFALNEQWCLNEKKAVFRAGGFLLAPADYARKVGDIFGRLPGSPELAIQNLRRLCGEMAALVSA